MYCSKCGAKIKGGAKFCQSCGLQTKDALSIFEDTQNELTKDERNDSEKLQATNLNQKTRRSTLRLGSIVLSVLIGFSLIYFAFDYKVQDDLEKIKEYVVGGNFDEANNQLENLEKSLGVILPIYDVEVGDLEEAVDEQRLCVLNEYPTYDKHSGIAGCVFWARHNDLEKREVWINDFKKQEDQNYCNQKYTTTTGGDIDTVLKNSVIRFMRSDDPRCDYDGFKDMKRQQNWSYLVSEQWDKFTEQCALESCPLPEKLNF